MKPLIVLFCFLIALASTTADAQTNKAAPAAADDAATKEIRAWLERWTKAFSTKDADAVMALYTDDVIAYDLVPPLQYIGKAAYRADYQQFFSQYDSDLKVEVRDLHVGATGDLGYAAGLELISGTLKRGNKYSFWVRFTSLFRKSDGRWLDFHDHVSVPADVATGKAMLDLSP
ncbi:MAG TPA: SgcJ/EcaC family oxidoreductase [Candidatus Udaeobacter sp.]|nr:SgcJ/EcaC family oxidoreductase [Candidatus Udaeobacter sp.]